MNAILEREIPSAGNLKFFSDLRNLPIVSIEEGQELGTLNSFLIDPDKKRLVGFILSSRDLKSGVKVVPFESVRSFGSFALTISSAATVFDLVGNPYFMQIFEKEVILPGSEVIGDGRTLLGFVKDVGLDPATGSLVVLKITSDAGFLSPYHAFIPFSYVVSFEKDRLLLSEGNRIEFKKETPFGSEEEDVVYVPLVAQDLDLKQLLDDRLTIEIDKIKLELRNRLFEHHEEYFITRQKEIMEKSMISALKGWFDSRLNDALVLAARDTSEYIRASVEALFESQHIRALNELVTGTRDELEQAMKSEIQARSEQFRQAHENVNARISDIEFRIAEKNTAFVENFTNRFMAMLKDSKAELSDRTEQTVARAIHALNQDTDAVRKELDALRVEHSDALKQYSESFDRKADSIRRESASGLEALEARVERMAAEGRSSFEKFQSAAREEWSANKNEAEERNRKLLVDVSRSVDDLASEVGLQKSAAESIADELRELQRKTADGLRADIESGISASAQENSVSAGKRIDAAISQVSEKFANEIRGLAEKFDLMLKEHAGAAGNKLAGAVSDMNSRMDSAALDAQNVQNRLIEQTRATDSLSRSIGDIIDAASKSNAALQEKIDAAAQAMDKSARDNESLRKELNTATEDFRTILGGKADAKAVDSRDEAIRRLSGQLADYEQRMKDYGEAAAQIKSMVEEKISRAGASAVSEVKDSIAQNAVEIEQLRAKTEELLAAAAGRLSIVEENWSTADNSLSEIHETIEQIKSADAGWESPVQELRNSLDVVNNLIRGTENRVEHFRDDVFSLKEEIEAARGENAPNNGAPALEAKISAIEQSLEALQTLLKGKNVNETVKALIKAQEDAAKKFPQLERKLDDLERALPGIEASLKELDISKSMDGLRAEISETAERILNLERKSEIPENKAAKAAAPEIAGIRDVVNAIKAAQADMEKRLPAFEEKLSSFDRILPAVAEFFTDKNLKEKIASIQRAQQDSGEIFESVQNSLSSLEEKVAGFETALGETGAHVTAVRGEIESRISALKESAPVPDVEPSVPPEGLLDELKTQIEKVAEKTSEKTAKLQRILDDAHRDAIDHAVGLYDEIKKSLDSGLEALSARIERLATEPPQVAGAGISEEISDAVSSLKQAHDRLKDELGRRLDEIAEKRQESAVSAGLPDGVLERVAAIEEKLSGAEALFKKAPEVVSREEALQLQEEIFQDALIQIDARFAGVAMQADIDVLKDNLREQFKSKLDSLRNLLFDALEGKIEELKSSMDAERIQATIDEMLKKRMDSLRDGPRGTIAPDNFASAPGVSDHDGKA